MPAGLELDLVRVLLAGRPGTFLAVGRGADPDEAFDDAVAAAWADYGQARVVPSIACVDAGTFEPVTEPGPISRDAALAEATRALTAGRLAAPGQVWAWALTENSPWRRRRVNVRFDDPAFPLGEPAPVPGPLALTDPLAEAVAGLLAGAGAPVGEQERFETVTLTRLTARYKPVLTRTAGPTERTWVLLCGGRVLPGEHPSAAEAAKAAKALAAGPDAVAVLGSEQAVVDVVALTRRAGGIPPVQVVRTRTVQRGAVKVVLAEPKDAARPAKTTGWLFAGTVGDTQP